MSTKEEQVAQLIQAELRKDPDGIGKRIRVHASGVKFETPQGSSPYWWVPVLIDPNETQMYRIYEVLSHVEEYFSFEGNENVFLVPAILEFA